MSNEQGTMAQRVRSANMKELKAAVVAYNANQRRLVEYNKKVFLLTNQERVDAKAIGRLMGDVGQVIVRVGSKTYVVEYQTNGSTKVRETEMVC